MKKKLAPFVCVISLGVSLGFLTGCNGLTPSDTNTKTRLDYGVYFHEQLKTIYDIPELNYDDLTSKVNGKKSFILVPYNKGCGCWTDFAPVLTEYMNKYHVKVEYICIDKFSRCFVFFKEFFDKLSFIIF